MFVHLIMNNKKLVGHYFTRNQLIIHTFAIAMATWVFPEPVGATMIEFSPSMALLASSVWYGLKRTGPYIQFTD